MAQVVAQTIPQVVAQTMRQVVAHKPNSDQRAMPLTLSVVSFDNMCLFESIYGVYVRVVCIYPYTSSYKQMNVDDCVINEE